LAHYLSTVRHLTAAQIWHRSYRTIKRRYWRLRRKRVSLGPECRLSFRADFYKGLPDIQSAEAWADEINSSVTRARAAAQKTFCFLQRTVSLGDQINWNDPRLSQLWRYQLHYFHYLQDVSIWAASGEHEAAYQAFRNLTRCWIEGNQQLSGDGWHPYTISLRVVNWLNALAYFRERLKAEPEVNGLIARSAYAQTQVLYSDLELDVRGNHLVENLRALIWAGLVFEGVEPDRWFQHGLELLEVETAEQILSDGGHFERSPGYHLVVLKDLLEIAVWLRRNGQPQLGWLDDALQRMRQYLWSILPPDGLVPLLKDSTWDGPDAHDLLTACAVYFDEPSYKCASSFRLYPLIVFGAEGWQRFASWPRSDIRQTSVALPATAHYVMRDRTGADYLIFDAGKPCPDYLPAHAHADLLTYELAAESRRIIVDSGVYEYTAGPWRDYFRSTRAHNTVEVEDENQSEVWASFRVGRRARPGPVYWKVTPEYVLAQGAHNGYRRLAVPVTHQRTIVSVEKVFWLVVDQLWGSGFIRTGNHIHFHPQLSLSDVGPSKWRIYGSATSLWLSAFGEENSLVANGQSEPRRQGWYSEKFGQLESNTVLTLNKTGKLPFVYGYVLCYEAPVDVNVVSLSGGHEIQIVSRAKSHTLTLVQGAEPRFA